MCAAGLVDAAADPAAALQRIEALLERCAQARAGAAAGHGADDAAEALALARSIGRADLQARAGHQLCFFLVRMGRLSEVLDAARDALPLLAAEAMDDAYGEVLRAQALCACELARFDIALPAAHELCARAKDDPSQSLIGANALAACLERMGDPWQGERVLAEAVQRHGAACGARDNMLSLNNLCAITIGAYYLLGRGVDDDEARAVLVRSLGYARRARELLATSADPGADVFVEGNLGEVLLHHGELDEAEALLVLNIGRARERGYDAQLWRMTCSMGEMMLARGRPAQARAMLRDLLDAMAGADPRITMIRARHALYRACRALGLFEEALEHFEACELMERQRASRQLRAQSQLFVTRFEAEQARRDAEHQRAKADEAALEAERDPLTRLGNRRQLERRFAALMSWPSRPGQVLTAAMLDIDHFKSINDTLGHDAGDEVLVGLAQMLRENTRATDIVVRLGGEEFVVVFPDTPVEYATEVCERLRERFGAHVWPGLPAGTAATLSIGLAPVLPGDRSQDLLRRADAALYEAKRLGRNRLAVG